MNSMTGKSLTNNSEFTCTMYTQGNDWVADMVPQKKEMKKMFKTIRLRFDSTRQMVSQVEMTEQGGDTTLITLKDVKLNGKVDEKIFVAQ
jgi:outer membrane lipoprotein-sorting protein